LFERKLGIPEKKNLANTPQKQLIWFSVSFQYDFLCSTTRWSFRPI